jgi:hypothetical protein
MTKRKQSVMIAECDGCGKRSYFETAEDEPSGYYGSARAVYENGGSGTHTFYACASACIEAAIEHVTKVIASD